MKNAQIARNISLINTQKTEKKTTHKHTQLQANFCQEEPWLVTLVTAVD